jgi:hypothetical protein
MLLFLLGNMSIWHKGVCEARDMRAPSGFYVEPTPRICALTLRQSVMMVGRHAMTRRMDAR